jgi:hypothetical protein
MKGTKKGIVLALWMVASLAGAAAAEPSYLVYPAAPAVFRYDTARYELVSSDNPKYNAVFAIGNQMLWDRVANRIPVEVYRAPELIGFEPSSTGGSEFVTYRDNFEIIVDGFSETPRTLGNLHLRFWPEPVHAGVTLSVNGQLVYGLTVALPSLDVTTPLGSEFYSDTQASALAWIGSSALRIIAFSDKDGDGAFSGTAAYSIVARSPAVPVNTSTWGSIKALYR